MARHPMISQLRYRNDHQFLIHCKSDDEFRMVHMEKTDLNEYLALPAGGKGPGLLVIHAWWGLNAFINRTYARQGS